MRSLSISFDQELEPDSRSTPAMRRALLSPFVITCTMLVAPVAFPNTRATCARGSRREPPIVSLQHLSCGEKRECQCAQCQARGSRKGRRGRRLLRRRSFRESCPKEDSLLCGRYPGHLVHTYPQAFCARLV